MHTFLEFFTYIKGIEYLLAVAFLLSFLVFWRFTEPSGGGGGGRRSLRFAPLLAVAAIVLVIVRTVTATPSPASLPVSLAEPKVFTFGSLVELYGPSSFDHGSHQKTTGDCSLCHHHSPGKSPPCRQCHPTSVSQEDLAKPDLARVYHRRCISCHRERDTGPLACTGCHVKATIPPLSITHPLTARDKCLQCHGGAIAGIPGVPDDHAGATDGVCQLCHRPSKELPSPIPARPTPPVPVPAKEVKPEPSPSAKAEGPAALRHETAGRGDCLLCHAGAGMPPDHAGRGNDSCLICHKPQQ
ncbi:MAG: hypothetical protein HY673_19445 [Chloroflexi bacterium]|nr:hypothetical protein [Chloroflexota bacterium]